MAAPSINIKAKTGLNRQILATDWNSDWPTNGAI